MKDHKHLVHDRCAHIQVQVTRVVKHVRPLVQTQQTATIMRGSPDITDCC